MGSEAHPSAPQFFVLKSGSGSSHDTSFEQRGGSLGDAPRCPRCGAFIGMKQWLPPRRGIVEPHGVAFGDLLRGPSGGLLASARFVEAFRADGLTGVSAFHPVEQVRVRGRSQASRACPPPYFYFTPLLSQAVVDDSRSRLRRTQAVSCNECRQTGVDSIHGFTLEAPLSSGEDVFSARGLPGHVLVSERFEHLVERHGLTNIQLIPTREYTWDPLELGPPQSILHV